MKTDADLKRSVIDELGWDPAINATAVGVSVKDGVVTLTGHLDSYGEKFAIEKALRRVAGVKAIALELDVKLAPQHKRSDTEIASAARALLAAAHFGTFVDGIQVKVENGWVTLTGEVEWNFQRLGHRPAHHARRGRGIHCRPAAGGQPLAGELPRLDQFGHVG